MNQFEDRAQQILKDLKINEETFSTILGGLVVVIIGLLIFNYFRDHKPVQQITQQAAQTENPEAIAIETSQPSTYTIQSGDSLQSIAEKIYGDPKYYPEIAAANNLYSADLIEVGQEIILPNIQTEQVAGAQTENEQKILEPEILPAQNIEVIKTDKYVVQSGDSLQTIAERAYGSQDRWPEIAQANNLWNPDYLMAGMEIVIPR